MEGTPTLTLRIQGLTNLSEPQKNKIKNACVTGEPVLSSHLFKYQMLKQKYSEARGYSTSQIYDLFMAGGDGPGNVKDKVVTIDVTGFYKRSSTIGWTTVNGVKTYINTRFLDNFGPHEVLGHLMHEYCHRLGFVHRWRKSASVPYKVGYCVRDCYVDFYKEPAILLEPKLVTFQFDD